MDYSMLKASSAPLVRSMHTFQHIYWLAVTMYTFEYESIPNLGVILMVRSGLVNA